MAKKTLRKYNRIATVLTDLDIQQKELAAMLKMNQQAINRICRNTAQPSLKTLFLIAETLDVEVCELLVSSKKKT